MAGEYGGDKKRRENERERERQTEKELRCWKSVLRKVSQTDGRATHGLVPVERFKKILVVNHLAPIGRALKNLKNYLVENNTKEDT
ncbi:hypothetical protein RUM43_003299 [Polyplax serrata]|uniref:Uncharacterized protein n=1 Tax=Polyplax serrata TaxID=468196 RepID=A0AAN8S5G9_POLSC